MNGPTISNHPILQPRNYQVSKQVVQENKFENIAVMKI